MIPSSEFALAAHPAVIESGESSAIDVAQQRLRQVCRVVGVLDALSERHDIAYWRRAEHRADLVIDLLLLHANEDLDEVVLELLGSSDAVARRHAFRFESAGVVTSCQLMPDHGVHEVIALRIRIRRRHRCYRFARHLRVGWRRPPEPIHAGSSSNGLPYRSKLTAPGLVSVPADA